MLTFALVTLLAFLQPNAVQPNAAQLKLLTTFRNEFVAIEPGKGRFAPTFEMGNGNDADGERPTRKIVMRQAFSIAKFEVPQNLWHAIMGRNPSRWKGQRNSVEMLSFDEAIEFCTRATKLMRTAKLITAKQEIRLPTEIEWEYAARAGTKSAYSFGDDLAHLNAHAWSTQNAAGNDPAVGQLKPNAWGIYDVHGYLWEWCLDSSGLQTQESTAGLPTINRNAETEALGQRRSKAVLRGGSWKDRPSMLTSGYRRIAPRSLRDDAVGLRCVLADVKAVDIEASEKQHQSE